MSAKDLNLNATLTDKLREALNACHITVKSVEFTNSENAHTALKLNYAQRFKSGGHITLDYKFKTDRKSRLRSKYQRVLELTFKYTPSNGDKSPWYDRNLIYRFKGIEISEDEITDVVKVIIDQLNAYAIQFLNYGFHKYSKQLNDYYQLNDYEKSVIAYIQNRLINQIYYQERRYNDPPFSLDRKAVMRVESEGNYLSVRSSVFGRDLKIDFNVLDVAKDQCFCNIQIDDEPSEQLEYNGSTDILSIYDRLNRVLLKMDKKIR